MRHGAEVNASTSKHVTALMTASSTGCTRSVKSLLEHGAKVNAVDTDGRTALMYACQLEGIRTWRMPDIGCVKALLQHGADIELMDSQGCTALMRVVMGLSGEGPNPAVEAQVALVVLLLEHGADITVTDNKGISLMNATGISKVVRAELDKAQHLSEHGLK